MAHTTPFRKALTAILLPALAVSGCATYQTDLSVKETGAILDGLRSQVDAERAAARAETAAQPPRAERDAFEEPVPETVDLAGALRVAAGRNRDLLSQRDGLVLSALALLNARNAIGPRLSGTIRHTLADTDRSETLVTGGGALGLVATLPTGAEATVTGDLSKVHGSSGETDTRALGALGAKISQPLLRGAGYDASHEQLTDAQRAALYDVRDFELARQDLALEVQQQYYGIVAQKQVVQNRELNLKSLEFLKRRSERLFEMGRVSEVDKFRATREHLNAENDLVDARQELDARLDRFKIQLGLDTSAKLDVEDVIPAPVAVDIDLKRGVETAFLNRLDLMTARDLVDDAERRERIRERDVLPDLRVELTGLRGSDGARTYGDAIRMERDSWGAGVSLELPLDRVRERGALRSARIAVQRTRRDLTLSEDQVILDVRSAVRNLRSSESSLRIQEQITASEEKNVKIARIRFEDGTIGNRDLTDALSNLTDARNRLIAERARFEVARLRLLAAVGTLTMNEDGTWTE